MQSNPFPEGTHWRLDSRSPANLLKDGFCHIVTYETHVNLGFNRGALLPDPNGVLAGTGKSIRHITIHSPNELEHPPIRRYLQAAIEQVDGPPTNPLLEQSTKTPMRRGRRPKGH